MKYITLENSDVKGMILDILRDLQQDEFYPDYVVGLTRGGLTPATMISHYLNIPMYALKVSFRESVPGHTDSVLWMAEDAYGHNTEHKNILIVDDINDSGKTLNWIKQDWQSSCFPNDSLWENVWHTNVKFASLVNVMGSDAKIDYTSMYIDKDDKNPSWVVFPWETWWK